MSMVMRSNDHGHDHFLNRFVVLPTPVRLGVGHDYTGKGVTIAFLDSGFYPHPDLTEPVNRIVAYKDVTAPDAKLKAQEPPPDWAWHGTQTSVVAAGNGHLSEGVYRGLAPEADIVLVKVSDEGRITEENIARGLRWVIENKERYNIRVVSVSLGGDEDAPYKENIVDQLAEDAVRQGLVVVVAAGNSGCGENHKTVPPANSPSVITVGGYDDNNQLGSGLDLYCSSYGVTADGLVKPEIIAPAMWVAAPILPGTTAYKQAEALAQISRSPDYMLKSLTQLVDQPGYLLSNLANDLWQRAGLPEYLRSEPVETIRASVDTSLKDGKVVATHYQHVDGTSFAAPIVSSVVAQMLEANPNLTPEAVKHILISTADRIQGAPVIRQGYGVLNAPRAIAQAERERHFGDRIYFCPPRVEAGKLVFTYHDDGAEAVAAAGDFNYWNHQHTVFAKDGAGVWRAEMALPQPGRYRYKFILNRTRWIEDPANSVKEPDSFGGFNSVLNIN